MYFIQMTADLFESSTNVFENVLNSALGLVLRRPQILHLELSACHSDTFLTAKLRFFGVINYYYYDDDQ
jgi:hypothetical protein